MKTKTGNIKLNVSYKDREGKEYSNSQEIKFNSQEEKYDNTGIRKAIVLTRYANTIKNWILYERTENNPKYLIVKNYGIIDCDYTTEEILVILGENERQSTKLTVSDNYKEIFKQIKKYIEDENTGIQDNTLNKEIETLNLLINY